MRAKSIPTLTLEQEERFWSKVAVPFQPSCCWEWQASRSRTGYGQIGIGAGQFSAHRVAYALLVGDIASELQLDHLCRNRACVNPDHLEPVTSRENSVRGFGLAIRIHRSDRCGKGHIKTPDWPRGKCPFCQKERVRRHQLNKGVVPMGTLRRCDICGADFPIRHGLQRVCTSKSCRDTDLRQKDARRRARLRAASDGVQP